MTSSSTDPALPANDPQDASVDVDQSSGAAVTGEVTGSTGTITLVGEIDYAGAPQLDIEVARLLETGARSVVVDFGAVSFFDSACLSALVRAREAVIDQGGELTLRRLSKYALRILDIAGVTSLFTVIDSPT